jgi:cysteine synthase A
MLDSIVDVDDGDAILMAQHLATELGLGVGISSGANLLGANKIHQELGPDAVVVTILPDSNKKYLSTDLFKTVPPGDHLLTTGIDLQGFDVITCASSKRFRCSKAVATGH